MQLTCRYIGEDLQLDPFKDRPTFVHITTHGVLEDGNFYLATETVTGKRNKKQTYQLFDLLGPLQIIQPKIAILNVCHSQPFGEFLNENFGIDHVIAIDAEKSVLTKVTRRFSTTFYRFLLDGFSVQHAFDKARESVLADPQIAFQGRPHEEFVKLMLIPDFKNHDKILGLDRGPGKVRFPPSLITNLPSYPSDQIFGRNGILWEINELLSEHANSRALVLHGFGGFGKTVISKTVAIWQQERNWWNGGAWFVNANDAANVFELQAKIESLIPKRTLVDESSKFLLVLDDIDHLTKNDPDELGKFIYGFTNLRSRARLLITLRHISELPDIGHHDQIKIERLDDEFVYDVFEYHLNGFDPWVNDNSSFLEQRNWLIDFLSGFPLAIKLAAAHITNTKKSLNDYRDQIEDTESDRLKFFKSGNAEHKDNNLSVSLYISYQSMNSLLKDLYPLLSFFPGGISETLIKGAFKGSPPSAEIIGQLEEIAGYSMVEVERYNVSNSLKERRFRLPGPANFFAELHAKNSKPQERYGQQILNFYCDSIVDWVEDVEMLSQMSRRLADRIEQGDTSRNLEFELLDVERRLKQKLSNLWNENANVKKWLEWGLESDIEKRLVVCLKVISKIARFWAHVSSKDEDYGIDTLVDFEKAAKESQNDNSLGYVNEAFGCYFQKRGEFEAAKEKFDDALILFNSDHDRARVLTQLSQVTIGSDRTANLISAIEIYSRLGDKLEVATCSRRLAEYYFETSDFESGTPFVEEWRRNEISLAARLLGFRAFADIAFEQENYAVVKELLFSAIQETIAESDFDATKDEINRIRLWGLMSDCFGELLEILERAEAETTPGSNNFNAISTIRKQLNQLKDDDAAQLFDKA